MKKKTVLVVMVLVLVAAGIVVLFGEKGGRRPRIVREGDVAPDFRLTSLDGKSMSLAGLRGKVVLLHFWATWCPPCVEEIPTLDHLYRTLHNEDLKIVAVSVDEGGSAAVGQFLQQKRLVLPVFLDPDHSVAGMYGTFRFPETYIIDRQGIVRFKVVGATNWTNPATVAAVKDILAAK
jgi:cytochrome c biogenesis protein CcmG/thiol:disulfide interchange protein DsbE